jgi:hypothetical protein
MMSDDELLKWLRTIRSPYTGIAAARIEALIAERDAAVARLAHLNGWLADFADKGSKADKAILNAGGNFYSPSYREHFGQVEMCQRILSYLAGESRGGGL